MKYTLREIATITGAELIGDGEFSVDYLLYDSRRMVPSVHSLFFALEGKRDGHSFVREMYRRGVQAFVVRRIEDGFPQANYLVVEDTLKALQTLAAFHRRHFDIPVIAVTGSNGKTIVKDWLSFLLEKFYSVVRSPRSFNSQIGVPLSVWEMDEYHEIAVLEAGISRPGEMQKLEQIIRPTIGIFTNLGDAHQENFISQQQKLQEKLILFRGVDKIFFPCDDELVRQTIKKQFIHKELLCWGSDEAADLQVLDIEKIHDKTKIKALWHNNPVVISIPFTDKASLHNTITVWLVLLDLLGMEKVNKLDFMSLPQVEMRLQQVRGVRGTVIINDSYNCDLTSLRIALDYLMQQSPGLKKTLILSDIEQTGMPSDKLYSELAQLVDNSKIDRFIGVGQNMVRYADFFNIADKHVFISTEELLKHIDSLNFSREIILLKGARRFRFERISRRLQEKTHRTVFEIDMNALTHNLAYFRGLLKPHTKIMVMVKAFSYGSGSYEIASLLQAERVDYLGVAIADEGVELREAGIHVPIIVMNPDKDTVDLFPEYSLEPEIYSFSMLEVFYNGLKDKIHYPLPVHIKFNTGMNRLGFDVKDLPLVVDRLERYRDVLTVRSVFSHLVASPEEEFDDFTLEQLKAFEEIVRVFKTEFGPEVIAHVLNSGGIERFPQYQMDMVRLGIGLYGISAVDNSRLKHIGTLKTRISQIRHVPAGQSIGYSRAEFVQRDSRIAILPIGYADGLNRRLSRGRGKVLIRGQLVPIVGNICMDMTMVDVTDVPGVQEDDEVIIFGPGLPITTVAQWLDTIPYEVLTGISHRVKRVYTWE